MPHAPIEEPLDLGGRVFQRDRPRDGEVPADLAHDLAPVPQEGVVGHERAPHASRGDLRLEKVAQPQQEGLRHGKPVSLGERGRDLQRVPDRDHGERGDLEPCEDVLPQRHQSAHPWVLDDPERLLAVGAFECLGQALTEARGGHRREPSRLGDADVVERRVRGAEHLVVQGDDGGRLPVAGGVVLVRRPGVAGEGPPAQAEHAGEGRRPATVHPQDENGPPRLPDPSHGVSPHRIPCARRRAETASRSLGTRLTSSLRRLSTSENGTSANRATASR